MTVFEMNAGGPHQEEGFTLSNGHCITRARSVIPSSLIVRKFQLWSTATSFAPSLFVGWAGETFTD
jgi:hypothetical protein